MLGIVLQVLGVIGIVLLVIVAIVLVLIVFVAVASLNYKFVYRYDMSEDEYNTCFLKINWLNHIVRCRVDISLQGIDYELRIFGFKSRLLDKYIKGDEDSDDEDCEVINYEDKVAEKDKYGYEYSYENDGDLSENNIKTMEHESESSTKHNLNFDNNEEELLEDIEDIWEDLVSETEYEYVEDEESSRKKSTFSWKTIFTTNPINLLVKAVKKVIRTIKNIINALVKTVKVLIRKYELVTDLWEKKSTQVAIERIKRYLNNLCRHIKPRKAKLRLDYGFEDPSTTGYSLGILGIAYGLLGEVLEVHPNFEEQQLSVDCVISGRMRVINLGIIVIRIIRDKAIKRLLRNIDKLKEELSNVR